jgi:hypothetical protein
MVITKADGRSGASNFKRIGCRSQMNERLSGKIQFGERLTANVNGQVPAISGVMNNRTP